MTLPYIPRFPLKRDNLFNNNKQDAPNVLFPPNLPNYTRRMQYKFPQSMVEKLYPNIYSALGKNIIVTDINTPTVKTHMNDINKIPIPSLKLLKDYGYKIYVGNKPVSDFPGMEDMKDKRPYGWGEGYTYKDVAGLYNVTGKVYLGSGNWDIPSLAIHELSHAIGDMMQVSSGSKLQKYYDEHKGKNGTYQADGGNYLEEFFAGSATDILMGNDKPYSKEYVNYLYNIFKVIAE